MAAYNSAWRLLRSAPCPISEVMSRQLAWLTHIVHLLGLLASGEGNRLVLRLDHSRNSLLLANLLRTVRRHLHSGSGKRGKLS